MKATSLARRLTVAVGTGASAALLAASTAAAQEGANGGIGSGVVGFGLGDWFGLMSRLALVVLVIWAGVWAMRWWVRRVNGGGFRARHRRVEVVETQALGPNRALHLVRLGDRAVLVGATPEHINSILEIDDPEEVERLAAAPEEPERVTLKSPLASMLGASLATPSLIGRLSAMPSRLAAARAARSDATQQETAAAPTGPAASAPVEAAAAPRRPFSFSDLVEQPTTVDEALALAEEAGASEMEPDDDPPPRGRSRRPRKPPRRVGLIEGFRRLPGAFRIPSRAPQLKQREEREPATTEPAPATTELVPAFAPVADASDAASKGSTGLFDRTLAASRGGSMLDRYAAGAANPPGGFSAALAAMEAQDRETAGAPASSRRAPSPPRPPSERETAAERAGLGELARDPQAFQRMTREQQIAQVQRAIHAVRQSMERSA